MSLISVYLLCVDYIMGVLGRMDYYFEFYIFLLELLKRKVDYEKAC